MTVCKLRDAITLIILCVVLSTNCATALEYSPPVANQHPTQVFWGDTHLHTNLSADSFTLGNQRIGPEDAYRFARGETVTSQTGVKAKLARPLDFLMIADHAELLGVFPKVFGRSADIVKSRIGKRWINYLDQNQSFRIIMEFSMLSMGIGRADELEQYVDEEHGVDLDLLKSLRGLNVDPELQQSIWNKVGTVAEQFNEPGLFTAFIGYEWTSTPDGNNLHRNVMFRDNASVTSKVVPFSALDSNDPEALWAYMADYEATTGGGVLAIPHNGNLSNGLMFAETTFNAEPQSKDYAERRARWEPVVEVTQMKGDSEAHPFLSPNDEFADYETWDRFNLFTGTAKQDTMLEFEYARAALKNGLSQEMILGANPFRFGMIGSTDSHNSLATADEDNNFGKATRSEPSAERSAMSFTPKEYESNASLINWELASSGYAAVWAKENTRASLFDAIRRKETYASTGPRITVRLFGGWGFEQDDVHRSDSVTLGYKQGVPMGAELPARVADKSPRFMVSALKDPLGANLERVQIVKAWIDEYGATHEKIYNVAASDNRSIRSNTLKDLRSTVNTDTANYSNSIGDAQLATVWEDPNFDPEQAAFYYARIIEIPTPRWTTIDAARYGNSAPAEAPLTTRERAYTSPIWYRPATSELK
ncbi:MAG: DUF3604 domain-containing protein [Pseudomonadales bacterium]